MIDFIDNLAFSFITIIVSFIVINLVNGRRILSRMDFKSLIAWTVIFDIIYTLL